MNMVIYMEQKVDVSLSTHGSNDPIITIIPSSSHCRACGPTLDQFLGR
jgi:hypothetical protein